MGYNATKMDKETIKKVYNKLSLASASCLPFKKPLYKSIDRDIDVTDKETDTAVFMVIVYIGKEWYELELLRGVKV